MRKLDKKVQDILFKHYEAMLEELGLITDTKNMELSIKMKNADFDYEIL